MLCTVSGDVRAPDVIEVPVGTPLREVLDLAGGPAGPLRAVLVGGYHGAWVTDVGLPLSATGLAPAGAAPGAGVLLALGWHQCPLEVSSRVVGYLAEQSARQCGPCLNGLPALAASMRALATPGCSPAVGQRLAELAGLVAGRGACHHPDGTVRLVRSVLTTFGDEVAAHVAGRCGGHV
jgi:NADH:ubiquinone oxidoreductase subunit F (NADH-binding)